MVVSYWDRFARARITRRRFLASAGTAMAAGGAIAVAGCGSSSTGGAGTQLSRPDQPDVLNPGGPPRRGGRLVSANSADFGTFDPHLGIAVASAYFPRLYNVLVNQSPTKPEFFYLDLAQSYEIPDETTYVFKLRPGVKVTANDLGVPERDLDGEDVRTTFERLKTDARANNYSFAHQYVDAVQVSGDTVTITSPKPYAWFLYRTGLFLNCIVPRELLAGNLDRLADKAAGAGPYRLTQVKVGEVASFDVNPNYYRKDDANGGAQLPYVDGLDVRVIFDRQPQRVAFESGQIHTYMTATGAEARSLGDAVIQRDPWFAFISFTMNPQQKPFDDPRVRRAISRAVDRDAYVSIVYGGDAKPDGLVHWPLGSYALSDDELRNTYQPYNVDEARRLVQEAGGIRFKMMYPSDTTIEEHGLHLPIFLRQMKDAGIDVVADPQDFGTWVDNYHRLNYQCSLALNQTYETPEIPLGFHLTAGPFGDHSYVQGIGDAEIDAAVRKADETLDADARRDAVHEAQKVIYGKDPMFLPLVSPYQHTAWSRRVKDIPAGIGTSAYLVNTFWMDV